ADEPVAVVATKHEIVLSQGRLVRVTDVLRLPFQLAVLCRYAVHRRTDLAPQVEMTVPRRWPAVTVDMVLGRGPDDLAGPRGAGPLARAQATRKEHHAIEDTGTTGYRLEIARQRKAPEWLARGRVERLCH